MMLNFCNHWMQKSSDLSILSLWLNVEVHSERQLELTLVSCPLKKHSFHYLFKTEHWAECLIVQLAEEGQDPHPLLPCFFLRAIHAAAQATAARIPPSTR